jgi:hypothetical protein
VKVEEHAALFTPGAVDHSPAMPPRSTLTSSISGATGQTDPISSIRARRSAKPCGRGLELNNVRMTPISLAAIAHLLL